MNDAGHDSPESAAMVGFPPQYCRVVAARVHEDDAYVLLDTGSPGQSYLYGVNCYRQNGRWFESTSSNGPGWHRMGDEVGTLTVWADAPEGASAVRMEFQGVIVEEPVRDGAYLFVWWRVPCPEEEWLLAILTPSGWNEVDEFELFRAVWPGKIL